MVDYATVPNIVSTFPTVVSKNASGAGATDGTPYIAQVLDDLWGRTQALMNRAGLIPDAVTESTANSQHIESLVKGFALGAGYVTPYMKSGTPVANGDRVLILTGQGVLIASYPELDAACWVGDAGGLNATTHAGGGKFYRASDAAGTTPNIAGPYLILPDMRGRVLRGDDAAASVDPDGATRFLGGIQGDTFQGHWHEALESGGNYTATSSGTNPLYLQVDTTGAGSPLGASGYTPITDGVNGTPRISTESRMTNVQVKFAITY